MKKVLLASIVCCGLAFANVCDLDFVKEELKVNDNLSALNAPEFNFNGVKCDGDTLIYDFKYNEEVSKNLEVGSQEQKQQIGDFMKSMFKGIYCETPDFENFRKNNVKLIYNYATTNNPNFLSLTLDNSLCQ